MEREEHLACCSYAARCLYIQYAVALNVIWWEMICLPDNGVKVCFIASVFSF